MILGFKQLFEDRTPTFFEEKILAGIGLIQPNVLMGNAKIHSIREGNRWHAGMPIQMAYGVRTKNYRQFNKDIKILSTCISTQRVFMTFDDDLVISVDGIRLSNPDVLNLIANDGLDYEQFTKWFFKDGAGKWSGQIIHWTDFKY